VLQFLATLRVHWQRKIRSSIEAQMNVSVTLPAERNSVACLKRRFGHEGLPANVMSSQILSRVTVNTSMTVSLSNKLTPATKAPVMVHLRRHSSAQASQRRFNA